MAEGGTPWIELSLLDGTTARLELENEAEGTKALYGLMRGEGPYAKEWIQTSDGYLVNPGAIVKMRAFGF